MTTPNAQILKDKLLFPFIAPPNGGKGTQTKILSQRYHLPTFDMGATFRAILKEGKDPQLAAELQQYMNAGKLVPIETVMKVFTKGFLELTNQHPNVKGYILDGFPRNLDQANALVALTKEWNARLGKVIYLNVSLPIVERRATGRRFCSKDASHLYSVLEPEFMPKQQKLDSSGQPVTDEQDRVIWLCDIDGADLIIRPDDEPATVQKRLKEYSQETDPIIERFRQSGDLVEINGEQAPDQVTRDIEQVLQPLLGLSPAS